MMIYTTRLVLLLSLLLRIAHCWIPVRPRQNVALWSSTKNKSVQDMAVFVNTRVGIIILREMQRQRVNSVNSTDATDEVKPVKLESTKSEPTMANTTKIVATSPVSVTKSKATNVTATKPSVANISTATDTNTKQAKPAKAAATTKTSAIIPPVVSTSFGRPLDVIKDKIPPIQKPIIKQTVKSNNSNSVTQSAVTASSATTSSTTTSAHVDIESSTLPTAPQSAVMHSKRGDRGVAMADEFDDDDDDNSLVDNDIQLESERPGTAHKKEGDRSVALTDEFSPESVGPAQSATKSSTSLNALATYYEPERLRDRVKRRLQQWRKYQPTTTTTTVVPKRQVLRPGVVKRRINKARLGIKYSRLSILEDRAFQILLDLGMIELHIDPRDASYDAKYGMEYAKENRNKDGTPFVPPPVDTE